MTPTPLSASLSSPIVAKREGASDLATGNTRVLEIAGGTAPYAATVKKQFIASAGVVLVPKTASSWSVVYTFPIHAGIAYRGVVEVSDAAGAKATVDVVAETIEPEGRVALPTDDEHSHGDYSVSDAEWPLIAEYNRKSTATETLHKVGPDGTPGEFEMKIRYNRESQRCLLYGRNKDIALSGDTREFLSFVRIVSCALSEIELETELGSAAWWGTDGAEQRASIRALIPPFRL